MSSEQLTGFEILEKRGQGGMATVWKARQVSLNRVVAIKILNTRLAHDPADVLRFQTEAQSAARLKHPGIVQVYDARVEHGLYFFVMEYVEGYTAGEWLRRRGALPEKDALLLADCVADALDYAWERERIIHCDIKPENVMVDADGTVKVADLGLSRSISAMSAGDASDEVFGTPFYISPEQSRGDAALDLRADIYSLGATMYHLLTGRMLFEGVPDEQVMDLQITSRVDDPAALNARLSKGVCWLLEKMLAKDPALRQQTWGAVRADIERVKRGLMPNVRNLPEGCSTIRRSPRRTMADFRKRIALRREEPLTRARRLLHLGGLWVLLALSVVALWRLPVLRSAWTQWLASAQQKAPPGVRPGDVVLEEPPRQSGESAADGAGVIPTAGATAGEQYDAARRWAEEHPEDLDQSRMMFEKVALDGQGTPYAVLASNEAARLTRVRSEAIEQVMEELKAKTTPRVDRRDFAGAARIYDEYRGRHARITMTPRRQAARDLRLQQERIEQEQMRSQWAHEKVIKGVLDDIVAAVLAGNLAEGTERINKALADERFADRREDLRRLKGVLAEAAGSDARVASSFRAQADREITVELNSGAQKLEIQDVHERTVTAIQTRTVRGAISTSRKFFTFDDLKPAERLSRMGPDENKGVALAKGALCAQGKFWSAARKYFETTDPLLSPVLLARIDELQGGGAPEKPKPPESAPEEPAPAAPAE